MQLATYLEALDDFSPSQLDAACRAATRVAEQFPKPGHIRSAAIEVFDDPHTGAEYLQIDAKHPLEIERIQRQLQYEVDKRAGLIKDLPEREVEVSGPRFVFKPQTRSIKEQKEILKKKGFL